MGKKRRTAKQTRPRQNHKSISPSVNTQKQDDTMLKNIFRTKPRRVKQYLPKCYKMIFRPGVFESIMHIKGWKNNSQIAQETGYTRQYISMLRRGVVSITTDFLLRILELTGNISNSNWSEMFAIIPRGEYNPNHQMWNNGKYEGRQKYTGYSSSGMMRRRDHDID